jgi:hypothetical protein
MLMPPVDTEGILLRSFFSEQGVTLLSHKDKELIIWQEFKERLATSNFTAFSEDPSIFI